LEDPSLEAVILITLDHRLDTFNAQKVNSKREKRLYILSLFTRLMLSTPELKVSWLFSLVISVKLNQKSENKSIKKSPNGEKKVELKSFQVSYSSMRSICSISNATLS
jgi:hypothetical protein